MNTGFNDFTNLSSVTKTLCNRLIPTEITAKYIKEHGVIEADQERNMMSQELKNILNDFYRSFLNENLVKVHELDFKPLFTEMKKYLETKDNKEALEKAQDDMRKAIHDIFESDDRYKKMFKAEITASILPEFILHNGAYSAEEKEEKMQVVKMFNGFMTSFSAFFTNRENCFSKEKISSSACYRIVDDNAKIHFDNIRIYKNIANKFDYEIEMIEKIEEAAGGADIRNIFSYNFDHFAFNHFVSQDDISFYNYVVGGINKFMNLYCQATKEKLSPYKLRHLHKQILCIEESLYDVPAKFNCDEDVYAAVNDFLNNVRTKSVIERLQMLGKNADSYDLDKIYISKKHFTNISQTLYRDFSVINTALTMSYIDTLPGKGKTKEKKAAAMAKNTELISLGEIDKLVDKYNLCPDKAASTRSLIRSISDIVADYKANPLTMNSGIPLAENETEIAVLKEAIEPFMDIFRWCAKFKTDEPVDKDTDFYTELEDINDEIHSIVSLYNRTRNYVTKKPYNTDKFGLYFGTSSFASGWSESKEFTNNAILLAKDDKFYLGVFNAKNKPAKSIIKGHDTMQDGDYKKMVYSLLTGPNKMLPHMFISSSKAVPVYGLTDELLSDYKKGRHLKTSKNFDIDYCHKLIDYFKHCLALYTDWDCFNFKFSDTESYNDIGEFYKEVAEQGYYMNWTYIGSDDIDSLQENDQLYLFQIYNKDFSEKSFGKPSKHTAILRSLFSDENVADPVIKLCGGTEAFFRPKSIKTPVVHKKGSVLVSKTYNAQEMDENGNIITVRKCVPDDVYMELYGYYNNSGTPLSAEALKYKDIVDHRTAPYDIIKDHRYTEDEFFINMPVSLNYKAENKRVNVNEMALKYIAQTKDTYIIGIDRGERNLLYVSVIDTDGNIVEQKSLNIINNVDYQAKLKQVEIMRKLARQNWKQGVKIADLKKGYLSQAVHEVAELVIKYNGIVVMEDLNSRFKEKRSKIERGVYQQFETSLIKTLNYLTFKDRKPLEAGGIANGYQLTYIPESLKNVGSQCGCILYVPAAYTSRVDPTTGFVSLFKFRDISSEKVKTDFIGRFDCIRYDAEKDLFAFEFDYDNFETYETCAKTKWRAYTYGTRVKKTFRNRKFVSEVIIDITEEIKKTLTTTDINWTDGHDIKQEIIDYALSSHIFEMFKLTVQMRNSLCESKDREYDKFVSPIMNASGKFFDTDAADKSLPIEADANDAYGIAMKGLYNVLQVKNNWAEGEKFKFSRLSNEDWFNFMQNRAEKTVNK